MNLEFVEMAKAEKDPHFRSKKYVIVDNEGIKVDPASGSVPVVLKHPDNVVVVVASRTGKAPPPAVGERKDSAFDRNQDSFLVTRVQRLLDRRSRRVVHQPHGVFRGKGNGRLDLGEGLLSR